MGQQQRYRIVSFFLKPILKVFCRLRYNIQTTPFEKKEGSNPPYLIIANHNSDFDPFMVAFCFDFPIYFVASDHIFRLGFISKVIKYLVSPIPKLKPTTDTKTIKEIMYDFKKGRSVCVFPEGNRSFNGETGYISPAIGKLVKSFKASLIICRIEGAYLFSPRWADHFRRGKVECKPVRELSTEELAPLSVDEINAMILKDLHVDAMATQEKWMIPYKGKDLAQSIETVLYTCPLCGRFATISSRGDRAFCDCGLDFSYDRYGYLIKAPFKTILAWDKWQKENLTNKSKEIMENNDTPIFSDEKQSLYTVERAKKAHLIDKGDFLMYNDRFVFQGARKKMNFLFRDISHINIRGRVVLQFSLNRGKTFEIDSKHPRSAYKYVQVYETLKTV